MSSLSPKNQPSSLPADLTTLVLILFDVGGVDSLIAEKEAKGLTQREQKMLQEVAQLIVLVERTAAPKFIEKLNLTAIN